MSFQDILSVLIIIILKMFDHIELNLKNNHAAVTLLFGRWSTAEKN